MFGDDKDKKKKPYRDIEDFINKIIEDFFTKPIMLPRIFEEFDRLMRELAENMMFPENIKPEKFGPRSYTWGFSIVIPFKGKPRIESFGNIRPEIFSEDKVEVERTDEFEPLASVYEENGTIRVVVDLPGVDPDNIKIDAKEKEVVIRAKGETRKYYKRLELPTKVDPESVEVKYKNGVLELKFKKK